MCVSENVKCILPDNGVSCVRILNEAGDHKLSLLPCSVDENGDVDCVDLADPDGKVLYCGVELELVNILVEKLGLGKID